jgi:hypothetical protein
MPAVRGFVSPARADPNPSGTEPPSTLPPPDAARRAIDARGLPNSSMTIEDFRSAKTSQLRRSVPDYATVLPSLPLDCLVHRNTLNFRHKSFCAWRKTVSPIRQKFALLNSKEKFSESKSARFQRLSTSIGRFPRIYRARKGAHVTGKIPSGAARSSMCSGSQHDLSACDIERVTSDPA